MKNLFLFSLLTLLFISTTFAQIQKGTILVGNNLLNLRLNQSDDNNGNYSTYNSLSLQPNGGYFLKRK